MKKIVILDPIRRGNWFFKASTLVGSDDDSFSVMLTIYNRRNKDRLYLRFFVDDARAAEFVEQCVSGTFGDTLQDHGD